MTQNSPYRTVRLPLLGRVTLWADSGFYGIQILGRQYDLRDHRRHAPLFSTRVLGHYCGRHAGSWCFRTRRLRQISPAQR
jgi:hypothetical protein